MFTTSANHEIEIRTAGPVSEAASNFTNPGHWCNSRQTEDATAPNIGLQQCAPTHTTPRAKRTAATLIRYLQL